MNNEHLNWLMHWYCNQCNGEWELLHGVEIGTLDNPGWFLKISLLKTKFSKIKFEEVSIEKTEDNWFHSRMRDGFFEGYGGPLNLSDIIGVFRDWVENLSGNSQRYNSQHKYAI